MPDRLSQLKASAPYRLVNRSYRRVRPVLMPALLFVLTVIAWYGRAKYQNLVLGILHDAMYDLQWHYWLLSAAMLTLLIGAAAAGATISMLGVWAVLGMKHILRPSVSSGQRMRKTFRMALRVTALSVACQILVPVFLSVATQEQERQNLGMRAVTQLDQMRTSTVERIANEERSGHWWADPDDNVAIENVKWDFARTNAAGREFVWRIIYIRLHRHWEPRHPIA